MLVLLGFCACDAPADAPLDAAADAHPPELGVTWTRALDPAPYPAQDHPGHVIATHDDALWLLADGEVWTSPDGVGWTRVATGAPDVSLAVSFGGELWGLQLGFTADTMWSSPDGVTWTDRGDVPLTDASSASRMNLVGWNDRLWIIGGEVLSSPDGTTWTPITSTSPTRLCSVLGFDDHLHALCDNQVVRTSSDGATWTPVELHAAYSYADTVAVAGGRMWIVDAPEVWASDDGLAWQHAATIPGLAGRDGEVLGSLGPTDGRLFLFGGVVRSVAPIGADVFTVFNDVWVSP